MARDRNERSQAAADDHASYPEQNRGLKASWDEFPKTVFAIFGNEFCERFSYYGMRTVLTLYVVNILSFNEQNGIALFHGFIVLCYSSPLLGSILADGYVGKFHTILWISLFYASGNIILAVAALYEGKSSVHPGLDLLGLIIIGLGTGGIKPCVSPFGGDQFKAGQERLLEAFFSVFYFFINAGALISSFITPMLRVMSCRDQDTCYSLAFGMPAVLMVISVICFAIGSPWFKKYPPKENIIFEFVKAIHYALKNKRKYKDISREFWLQHLLDDHDCKNEPRCTKEKCYTSQLVEDMRAVLQQCVMCVPMPVFWALYDQQGSVWVLQAVDMDGRLWAGANLLPDQMPTLNAALILIFIPIFQFGIYPLVRKCGINPTPLRRMTVGGFLIAGCFIISMFIQFAVNNTLPNVPGTNEAYITFINTMPCNLTVSPLTTNIGLNTSGQYIVPENGTLPITGITTNGQNLNITWTVTGASPGCWTGPSSIVTPVTPTAAFYTVLANVSQETYPSMLKKSITGEGQFKLSLNYFLSQPYQNFNQTFFWCSTEEACTPKDADTFEAITGVSYPGTTGFVELKPGQWALYYENVTTSPGGTWWKDHTYSSGYMWSNYTVATNITLQINGQGGIYSLTITGTPTAPMQTWLQIATDNTISILWQIPQYIVVTAAEILFSITGLEFSYSQAPLSMKSAVGALWLLTNAVGDVLVLIIEESGAFPNPAYGQLCFAIIMAAVMVIFMCLAIFWYKSVEFLQHEDEDAAPVTETSFVDDDKTVRKKH